MALSGSRERNSLRGNDGEEVWRRKRQGRVLGLATVSQSERGPETKPDRRNAVMLVTETMGTGLRGGKLRSQAPANHHRRPLPHSLTENGPASQRTAHSTWLCIASPCTGTGAGRLCRQTKTVRECADQTVLKPQSGWGLLATVTKGWITSPELVAFRNLLHPQESVSTSGRPTVWPSECRLWMEGQNQGIHPLMAARHLQGSVPQKV